MKIKRNTKGAKEAKKKEEEETLKKGKEGMH